MKRTAMVKNNGTSIIAHARPYLTTEGGHGVFGRGKGELLAAVEKMGSLRNAASILGRSYRQAWGDINNAEKYLGFSLVTRLRGGPCGGTMQLTERGKLFLRAWELHCRKVAVAVEKSYIKNVKSVINYPKEAFNG